MKTKAEIVTAFAAIVTALATISLAVFAAIQILQLRQEMAIQEDRERRLITIEACTRFVSDPIIHEASRRLWDASDGGTDYTLETVDRHDVITVLNYLDSLATGIEQDIYIEEIVRAHYEHFVAKAVVALVRGESSEPHWKADTQFAPEEQIKNLIAVHNRWSAE